MINIKEFELGRWKKKEERKNQLRSNSFQIKFTNIRHAPHLEHVVVALVLEDGGDKIKEREFRPKHGLE